MFSTSSHRFRIADLAITLVFVDETIVFDIPLNYQKFLAQESNSCDDEIRFQVVTEKPPKKLQPEHYHLKSPIWNVFQTDQHNYYELVMPLPYEYDLLIQHQSGSKEGIIYTHVEPGKPMLYPLFSPVDQAMLISALSHRKGLLVHACGLVKDGCAMLFSGFSGIGKTTTASLWKDVPGVELLNDDRIFLRVQNGEVWAYGTPWSGSMLEKSPVGAPLDRIFFLHQDSRNWAAPLKPSLAASQLLVHAFPASWDKNNLNHNLETVHTIVNSVSCFNYHFFPDRRAVDYIKCLS